MSRWSFLPEMVDQSQKRSNTTSDHAGFAIRTCTEVWKIKLDEAEPLNFAHISQINAITFNTVPRNTDVFFQNSHEFKISISTVHAHPFPLPNYYRIIDLPILLQYVKQYSGWSRSYWWHDCNSCCVGCNIMLQGHTSRQIICLDRWSNTYQAADCTVMRKWKWLFVTGCELQEMDFYISPKFKLMPRCGKCISEFGYNVER